LIRQRHRATAGIFLLTDLFTTLAAFFVAWVLRFELEVVPVTKDVPDFRRYLELLPVILLLWPIVFYFHGLYQIKRGRSKVDEGMTVLLAVFLATVLLSGFIQWYRPPRAPGDLEYFTYSRAFLALFALSDLLLAFTGRLTTRALLRVVRLSGHNLQRILIVGAGNLGKEIGQKLLAHRELGFEVVGFLDDDPGKAGRSFFGLPVVGTLRRIDQVLARHRIDQVYIALPVAAHRKTMTILEAVGRECVDVKLVPDILQYATLKASLEDVDGTPVINLSQVPLQGWNSLVKRTVDIALAGTALLAASPLLPLAALAIWLEDRGPIFYRQERMGLDGRPFMILKFRSMRVDAESTSGPVWAIRDDPRRTRVGRLVTRRIPPAVERPQGGDVDRRPPPRAARLRPRVQAQGPAVHAPPPRQVGHHRLGAGPRLARQHLHPQADPVRPLLHRELVAEARLQDPLDDLPPRPEAQRVLAARGLRGEPPVVVCGEPAGSQNQCAMGPES
jgi:hypothetical protein